MTAAASGFETAIELKRRQPVGAEIIDGRVHVRVWAPAAQRLEVVLSSGAIELSREPGGYFSGWLRAARGDRYQFRIDGSEQLYPDPASRYQPDGPHGPSAIEDPAAFEWTDRDWPGVTLEGQVLYELHPGTFTREGTFRAAARELPELAALGITVIEVMPVAEFDGRFGWGYDGVDLFAPSHLYGTPDDFRFFVDRAHAAGLGVILDVVYNHLGPVGNYLRAFAPAYFTDRYDNEWGDAINFDGEDAAPVREFFIANAGYWIEEFHLDGLRLDATQQIFDASSDHIVAAIGREVRTRAGGRATLLVAENESQEAALVRPAERGGLGLDAVWNDDFHHSAMVALTGRREAYYCDTPGEPQEFVSAAKYGFLFQGQYYEWQDKGRGTVALDVEPARFVVFLQNHDQVANSARGLRGHELTSPGRWRAMTALFLLMPGTPMLFQGQEFAASSPFLYFADFDEELMRAVRTGRREFLLQFPSVRGYAERQRLDDPADPRTRDRCVLDFSERTAHAGAYALHKDLLRVRRELCALGSQQRGRVDGAVIGPAALALRFFGTTAGDDRLLLVNLGSHLARRSFAEPLLAPSDECGWQIAWSSEEPLYGGGGTPAVISDLRWQIPGETAILLQPCAAPPRVKRGPKRRTA